MPLPPKDITGIQQPVTDWNEHLWKSDQEWILLFDNLMRCSTRKRSSSSSQVPIVGGHQYHPSAQPAQLANNYNSNVSPIYNIGSFQRRAVPPKTTPSAMLFQSNMTAKPRNNNNTSPGPTITTAVSSSHNVGGVEAENFIESFLDVPRINNIISGPAVEQEMSRINQVLSDVTADWTKRVDALKRLRSVVICGGDLYKEFYSSLRFIDVSLICSVKDLRSQVVRETCVTLAFLSQQLGHKFERTAEVILPFLISLIPNSAKIISSSGTVTIRFILQNTHSPKLVPIIVNHLQTSRSKDVRRYCCEFVKHILFIWPKEAVEKHAAIVQDAIKRGIVDADPEARSLSRQAYWHFTTVFPNHADVLISQLDSSNKKMLEDNRGQVAHSSLQQRTTPPRDPPSTLRSSSRPRKNEESESEGNAPTKTPIRSSSAIDADAVRRARSKTSGIPSASVKPPSTSGLATPLRSRKTFVTSSKPSSRATSPAITPRNGFSRSTANSRDNSPEKLNTSKKAATGRSPSVSAVKRNPTDSKGYQSENEDTGSQYGSQASLSGARYIYSVSEILGFLGSPNWSSRKEGLLGLQKYLRTGTLYPADVDNVRLLLTRMMSDPTTKVFSLFLDTLYDFISVHKLDLGSWLYTLLTRLLGKMSVDLLPSVQCKIDRCLELIRGAFSAENQFQQLLKFINDSLQTPNSKVKMAFLAYLVNLIRHNMLPSDFKNTSAVRIGITKLVNWSMEAKTPELRKASQNVLVALHELNAGEFTSMLALMDEYLRDTALKVLSGPPKREMADKAGVLPTATGRSRQHSLSRNGSRNDVSSGEKPAAIASPQSSNDENINPEDYYACLRQTTQAIEKFSLYSHLDYSSGDEGKKHPGSEDSGFSRNSLNVPATADDSEHSSQTEETTGREGICSICSLLTDQKTTVVLEGLEKLELAINTASEMSNSEKDSLAKSLESTLNHSDSAVILSALHVCKRAICKDPTMLGSILPVILDLQGDSNRQVSDKVDKFLLTMKDFYPLAYIAEVLGLLLMEAEPCLGIKAASLLLQIVQTTNRDILHKALPDLMPIVVQGFNVSAEPNIRKECMLCIIDIQLKFGADAVFPYIKDLSVNKIKLLNLYLQRK